MYRAKLMIVIDICAVSVAAQTSQSRTILNRPEETCSSGALQVGRPSANKAANYWFVFSLSGAHTCVLCALFLHNRNPIDKCNYSCPPA